MIYNLETAMNHCSPHQPQIFCNHGSWSLTHSLPWPETRSGNLTSKQFPRLTINYLNKCLACLYKEFTLNTHFLSGSLEFQYQPA